MRAITSVYPPMVAGVGPVTPRINNLDVLFFIGLTSYIVEIFCCDDFFFELEA
jgi:hypothetical protein